MWTLVFIYFVSGEPKSVSVGTYSTMYECFDRREELSVQAGGKDGYFPEGTQAVCVYMGNTT